MNTLYIFYTVTAIGKDDKAASNDEESNVSQKSGNFPCCEYFVMLLLPSKTNQRV